MSDSMVRVYVAGPYTGGDPVVNVRNAMLAADELMDRDFAPYVPHLMHFQHLLRPRAYDDWLMLDHEWVLQCHAVLRLPGHSPGADTETALAQENGIMVFTDIDTLTAWRNRVAGGQDIPS